MKRQFAREAHNRHEKALKPDYRPEMQAKKPTYTRIPDYERAREARETKEYEIRRIRRYRFFLNGRQCKLDWSLDHFAKINAMQVLEPATKEAYEKLKAAAGKDYKDIADAIMKGKAHKVRIRIKGLPGPGIEAWDVDWRVPQLRCDGVRK